MMKIIRRHDLENVVNLAKRRAWFAAPHAFVIFSIEDYKGKVSPMKINFPQNVDIGVLRLNFVPTTATLINALILGKIVSAGIGIEVDISGATIRATPDVNSDVEEGTWWPMVAANGAETGFRLPTFDEAKLIPGGQFVDLTDTDAAAFAARLVSGQTVSLTNVSPSTDRGEDVTVVNQPYEQFKASRKKRN